MRDQDLGCTYYDVAISETLNPPEMSALLFISFVIFSGLACFPAFGVASFQGKFISFI